MLPRIEQLASKKLVGTSMKMTLTENKTFELWSSFMRSRKSIKQTLGTALYSMQVYDEGLNYIKDFNAETAFTKWAAVEVTTFDDIPEGLFPYELKGGLYAVFHLKGVVPEFIRLSHYIFEEWLPNSNYELDNREHFELLGEKYKRNASTSEEEIWIPIK